MSFVLLVSLVVGLFGSGLAEWGEALRQSRPLADDRLARIHPAACMGCGVCVSHCPQKAISLLRDPAKGEPLEIQKLIVEAAPTTRD